MGREEHKSDRIMYQINSTHDMVNKKKESQICSVKAFKNRKLQLDENGQDNQERKDLKEDLFSTSLQVALQIERGRELTSTEQCIFFFFFFCVTR